MFCYVHFNGQWTDVQVVLHFHSFTLSMNETLPITTNQADTPTHFLFPLIHVCWTSTASNTASLGVFDTAITKLACVLCAISFLFLLLYCTVLKSNSPQPSCHQNTVLVHHFSLSLSKFPYLSSHCPEVYAGHSWHSTGLCYSCLRRLLKERNTPWFKGTLLKM